MNHDQWNVTDYWEVYPKSYYDEMMSDHRLYVLECNSKVVAALVCLESDGNWKKDSESFYIHNFVTDERYKGCGKVLLNEIEKLANIQCKVSIRLDCAIDNVKLNKYYDNQGYQTVGVCKDGPYIGNKKKKKVN